MCNAMACMMSTGLHACFGDGPVDTILKFACAVWCYPDLTLKCCAARVKRPGRFPVPLCMARCVPVQVLSMLLADLC
jgi:hypothetical protein